MLKSISSNCNSNETLGAIVVADWKKRNMIIDLGITLHLFLDDNTNTVPKKIGKRPEDRDLYDDEDDNLLCLCRCYPCCIISCLRNITKVYDDKKIKS